MRILGNADGEPYSSGTAGPLRRPRGLLRPRSAATFTAQYLNSGILPYGIERRIGQLVGGGLGIGEGNEDAAAARCRRPPAPSAGWRRAATPPRPVARLQAEPAQLVAVHRHGRLGLDGVEHVGAAGHRAGVPVLELPAGDQDERVLANRAARPPGMSRPAPGGPCRSAVGKRSMNTTGCPGSSSSSARDR